jgi:hypothetical protein
MPAPQASMMENLAKVKFASFALRVPENWQEPSGDPAADHYSKAIQPSEKVTSPAVGAPLLFTPASMVKYHTDTQKMLQSGFGDYIKNICSAICSAWSQWQTAATMVGIVVTGPMASVGQIVGPPLGPLILASAPMDSPMKAKYSTAIANAIGIGWLTFTATVKFAPPLPLWPAYAAVPTPVAPPMPNVPQTFAALMQVPVSISANVLKTQMIGLLADPKAQYHQQLFEAVATAFEQCYTTWKASTMINNVTAIATGGTPISPIPAVGTAIMPPGGFT